MVLGMHRSGTSSVAGVLNLLGASAPKNLIPGDVDNERGYFESALLNSLHGELLTSAGSSWDDWRAFNPAWYRSAKCQVFKQQAEQVFKLEFGGDASPILKDPRISRFAPFWFDVLGAMDIAPRIIIPIRSPLEVARSLRGRDGFPLTKGLLIWLRHVLDAEAETRSLPRAIFSWNEFLSDWRAVAQRISDYTEIAWPRMSDRTARQVDEFLNRDLKHHTIADKELIAHPDVHEWTRVSYEALLTLAQEPGSNSARIQLDTVRAAFESACHLFGRVVLDYETTLEAQHRDNTALQSYRNNLAERCSTIEEELRTAQEVKEVLIAERDALQDQVQASVIERHRIAEQLEIHVARADELAGQLDRANHLEAEQNAVNEQLQAAKSELTRQITLASELISQRDDLQTQLHAASSELTEQTTQTGELISQRDDLQMQLHAARSEFIEQTAQTSELISLRDELQTQLQTATANLDHVVAELAENLAGKNMLFAESDALRLQLQQEAAEKERLQEELNGTLAERKRMAAEPLLALLAQRFRRLWT